MLVIYIHIYIYSLYHKDIEKGISVTAPISFFFCMSKRTFFDRYNQLKYSIHKISSSSYSYEDMVVQQF